MSGYFRRTTCRACEGNKLTEILDLGVMPPANAYVYPENIKKQESKYPLTIHFCLDCYLLQVLDVVSPELLFKNYHYTTGSSEPMRHHFHDYAEKAVRQYISGPSDLVIDIGGNDGLLLEYVKPHARILNIDPADNLEGMSRDKDIPFYPAFFSSKTADDIVAAYGAASVVTANNVFAHIDPIRDVFEGAGRLIGDDGVFICEVHWVKHLLDEACFDQIYHEHLCFYSLHALQALIRTSGMTVFDVEIVPTQGQSLRVFAAKNKKAGESIGQILEIERAAGLLNVEKYLSFARSVEQNKREAIELIDNLKSRGKRIVGYGAPAKGNTLLNYYGLDTHSIDYLIDSTPAKQGLYSPGALIPIFPPSELSRRPPDFILLLAWNYKEAILRKEASLLERGVKFFVTAPKVSIL